MYKYERMINIICLGLPKVGSRSVQQNFTELEPEPVQMDSELAEPEPEPPLNRGSVQVGFGSKVDLGSTFELMSLSK